MEEGKKKKVGSELYGLDERIEIQKNWSIQTMHACDAMNNLNIQKFNFGVCIQYKVLSNK